VGINQPKRDSSYQGATLLTRNNWVIIRKRISDDDYDSELGEEESSLSAYNGGVTETIAGPVISGYTIGPTVRNYTNTTDVCIPTGQIQNGSAVYATPSTITNIPDSEKRNVLHLVAVGSELNWSYGEFTQAEVDTLTVPDSRGTSYVYDDSNKPAGSLPVSLNMNLYGGTFVGSNGAIASTYAYPFTCTGDNQVYEQQSVDWYTQRQTWVFKDGWQ